MYWRERKKNHFINCIIHYYCLLLSTLYPTTLREIHLILFLLVFVFVSFHFRSLSASLLEMAGRGESCKWRMAINVSKMKWTTLWKTVKITIGYFILLFSSRLPHSVYRLSFTPRWVAGWISPKRFWRNHRRNDVITFTFHIVLIVIGRIICLGRNEFRSTIIVEQRDFLDYQFTQIECVRMSPMHRCWMTTGVCLVGDVIFIRCRIQYMAMSSDDNTSARRLHRINLFLCTTQVLIVRK